MSDNAARPPGPVAEGGNTDIPYLDLRYYSANHPEDPDGVDASRQGQALDLAQSFAMQAKTLASLPPSLTLMTQHTPLMPWQNPNEAQGYAGARPGTA